MTLDNIESMLQHVDGFSRVLRSNEGWWKNAECIKVASGENEFELYVNNDVVDVFCHCRTGPINELVLPERLVERIRSLCDHRCV